MIKKILVVVLILMTLRSYSQNVKIHGNIKDTVFSAVILSPNIYSKLIDSKIEFRPKNGYFEFNIQVDNPSFYTIYYKEKRINLFVKPSSNIQLAVENSKEKDFVIFYEDYALENNYYNRDEKPIVGNKVQKEKLKELAIEGNKPYFVYLQKEMADQKASFQKDMNVLSYDDNFKYLYEKNYIDMSGVLNASYFPYYAKMPYDSFIVANPQFLNLYDAIDKSQSLDNVPYYLENQMILVKSKAYLALKDSVINRKLDDLVLYKQCLAIVGQYSNGYLKQYLTENLIGEWVSYYGRTIDIKDEIVNFTQSITNDNKLEAVKKRLVSLAQYETGKPAPIFSFEDNSGNVRNLKEYVGKVVYIEVWASWCTPCVQEIPHSKELYDHYKDNPSIQFLYISIDDKKENWEKALRQHKMNEGVQGIAFPDGFKSDFAKKYSIQGIPNCILIDKSGNMVLLKAPLPSQKDKIYPLLNSALGLE